MTCSECGSPVQVDQLRCQQCGHDMLAEDIARQPANKLAIADDIESVLTGLVSARERLAARSDPEPLSPKDAARLAAATEEMRRARWRLVPILGVFLLAALAIHFLLK